MAKVSVKYRTMTKRGVVVVRAGSVWNDRNGTHYRPHNVGDYDAVAIYCPDTSKCYYLLAAELAPTQTTLRISESGNNQMAGVRMARWFVGPDRMFASAPVAQWTERSPSKRWAEGSIPSGGASVEAECSGAAQRLQLILGEA